MKIRNRILSLCMLLFLALMMNSSEVYAAGSFSVSGGGTVSAGGSKSITISASDCAGVFSISASGGGSVSASTVFIDSGSTTVTVTAPSSGSTTVTVTASDVTGYDDGAVTGSKSVTVKVESSSSNSSNSSSSDSSSNNSTTTEVEEDTRSTNNSLSALSVSEGTLSPAFSASTTEYTVNVVDIASITISASAADATATTSGTGEKSLELGVNDFSVVVTAENGSTKTYKIAVTLTATPTAFVTYGEAQLGVVKDTSSVSIPDGFEETTVTVDGEEVTAWTSNLLGLTLLYMVDEAGNESFYVYDEAVGTVESFEKLGLLGRTLYVLEIAEEEQAREGMVYQLLNIEGNEIMGWSFEDEALADYFVIYVMSDTGEMVSYLYCATDNAMILAPDMAPVSSATYEELVASLASATESVSTLQASQDENNELLTYGTYILIGCAVLVLILVIVIIILSVKVAKLSKAKKALIAQEAYDDVLGDEYDEYDEEMDDFDTLQEEEADEVVAVKAQTQVADAVEEDMSDISGEEAYEIFDID